MNARILTLAFLTSWVASLGCAFEQGALSDEDLGTQSSTLNGTTSTTEGIPQANGPSNELNNQQVTPGGAKGDPGAGHPEEASGEESKPSPDPWLTPGMANASDPKTVNPVDPRVVAKPLK